MEVLLTTLAKHIHLHTHIFNSLVTIDATQFAAFMKNITDAIAAVRIETAAGSITGDTTNSSKIFIKLPIFKRKLNENVDI